MARLRACAVVASLLLVAGPAASQSADCSSQYGEATRVCPCLVCPCCLVPAVLASVALAICFEAYTRGACTSARLAALAPAKSAAPLAEVAAPIARPGTALAF